jgi:hypothetical protein
MMFKLVTYMCALSAGSTFEPAGQYCEITSLQAPYVKKMDDSAVAVDKKSLNPVNVCVVDSVGSPSKVLLQQGVTQCLNSPKMWLKL